MGILFIGIKCFGQNNNNRLFMAPYLVRTRSAYKDKKIRSFHHTHTHTHACTHAFTHARTHPSIHTYTHILLTAAWPVNHRHLELLGAKNVHPLRRQALSPVTGFCFHLSRTKQLRDGGGEKVGVQRWGLGDSTELLKEN